MDLTPSADQRDLRAGLRDFLRGTWTPDRLRAAADGRCVDRKEWSALAELGVFGLILPEAGGGMGLGLADAAIVFEELGRALVPGPVAATFLAASLAAVHDPADTDPAGPVPARAVREASVGEASVPEASVREASVAGGPVPGAADGEAVVTMLDTRHPVPVVEHLEVATHAVVVADDGLFVLPAAGLAAATAGIPLDPLTPVSVLPSIPEGTARGRRIGGAADSARWRLYGTVLTAALQVGVAQGGLDLAVRYARERSQFGRPIGSFQAVKHLLAESLVRTDLARAQVLVAALTVDDPQSGDQESEASAAKLLADDAATTGGRTCVQVHGGMGFTWEVLAHLYAKRAWVLETCFGGSDEHAARLADTFPAQG